RVAVQVVALAALAVIVGTGIADAVIREVELRIVGARHPDAGAAALPRVAGPRVVAALAGPRNGVEAPRALPGLRVVGVDEAADAVLAAGDADNHLVLDDERRDGGRVPLREVFERRVPDDRAGLHVERQQVRVERRHEEAIAEDAESPVDEAAARGEAAGRRQLALVTPDFPPGARV